MMTKIRYVIFEGLGEAQDAVSQALCELQDVQDDINIVNISYPKRFDEEFLVAIIYATRAI